MLASTTSSLSLATITSTHRSSVTLFVVIAAFGDFLGVTILLHCFSQFAALLLSPLRVSHFCRTSNRTTIARPRSATGRTGSALVNQLPGQTIQHGKAGCPIASFSSHTCHHRLLISPFVRPEPVVSHSALPFHSAKHINSTIHNP